MVGALFLDLIAGAIAARYCEPQLPTVAEPPRLELALACSLVPLVAGPV